ncbi:unnamed protein product [Urochloa decumbens]|uniref:Uncharacterized protein n=1 Tax=Urochloa decumbens TaxID=240449 RepID=A0ABC9B9W9_9POAL
MGSSMGVPSNVRSSSSNQIGMAMALPQPMQPTRLESRCTPKTAQGTISFEITGYRQLLRAFAGKFIRSSSIEVGGYSWCLHYYPDGDTRKESKGFVGVYLELLTKNVEVKGLYDFRLVDLTTGSPSVIFQSVLTSFNTVDASKHSGFGLIDNKFLERKELEASSSVYLRDDCLMIECDITVVSEPLVVETTKAASMAQALHRNLSRDFANLLKSKEGADVTFEVQGEVIAAHTIMLAARSPVLKAQFYGPLKEQIGEESHVTIIEDMQPAVFKELLHFIYADSLSPSIDDLDGDEKIELAKHLLVAGDQYDVQGLRSVCETNLCESLDVSTVADMLVFADQHSCEKLKDACIEFIACNDKLDDLVASNGYDHLKSSCPAIFVDLFEKAARSCKI